MGTHCAAAEGELCGLRTRPTTELIDLFEFSVPTFPGHQPGVDAHSLDEMRDCASDVSPIVEGCSRVCLTKSPSS